MSDKHRAVEEQRCRRVAYDLADDPVWATKVYLVDDLPGRHPGFVMLDYGDEGDVLVTFERITPRTAEKLIDGRLPVGVKNTDQRGTEG